MRCVFFLLIFYNVRIFNIDFKRFKILILEMFIVIIFINIRVVFIIYVLFMIRVLIF